MVFDLWLWCLTDGVGCLTYGVCGGLMVFDLWCLTDGYLWCFT